MEQTQLEHVQRKALAAVLEEGARMRQAGTASALDGGDSVQHNLVYFADVGQKTWYSLIRGNKALRESSVSTFCDVTLNDQPVIPIAGEKSLAAWYGV